MSCLRSYANLGRIQNMDPGPWTTHVDPVHGPPHGLGPWTTPTCGPGQLGHPNLWTWSMDHH